MGSAVLSPRALRVTSRELRGAACLGDVEIFCREYRGGSVPPSHRGCLNIEGGLGRALRPTQCGDVRLDGEVMRSTSPIVARSSKICRLVASLSKAFVSRPVILCKSDSAYRPTLKGSGAWYVQLEFDSASSKASWRPCARISPSLDQVPDSRREGTPRDSEHRGDSGW